MIADVVKEIFWLCLNIMKSILSLAEFKLGKNSDDYRYFKAQVMSAFYDNLTRFYQDLVKKGILERCPNNCKLRQGYNKCQCGGSGYVNKK